jgi:hypothetical protein
MRGKAKYWVGGLASALIGLILAKIVAGMFAEQVILRLGIYLVGTVMALSGLVIIAVGIRKRDQPPT